MQSKPHIPLSTILMMKDQNGNPLLDTKTRIRILNDIAIQIEAMSRLSAEEKTVMQRDIISQNIFLPADWQQRDEKSTIAFIGENNKGIPSLRPNDGTHDYYHQPPHSLSNDTKLDSSKMVWQWGLLAYEVWTDVPFDQLTAADRERIIKKRLKPLDAKMGEDYSQKWMGSIDEGGPPYILFDAIQYCCWHPCLDMRPSPQELVQIMQSHYKTLELKTNSLALLELITGKKINAASTTYLPENPPNKAATPTDRFISFIKVIFDEEKNCKPEKRAELKAKFDEARQHDDWLDRLWPIIHLERKAWLVQHEIETRSEREHRQFCNNLYEPGRMQEKELQQTAEKYFKSVPIPPAPTTKAYSDILSGNVVLGEVHHSDIAPKKFLIEKMKDLKSNGFDTLFMEFLYYDDQHLLDNYFATGIMDPKLQQRLEYLDGHKLKAKDDTYNKLWQENNFLKIVQAARAAGIRVVAIDTREVYETQGTYIADHTHRLLYMNYTAHQIMNK